MEEMKQQDLITLTNAEIFQITETLSEILKRPMKGSLSFSLLRAYKKIFNDLEIFNKTKEEIFCKYGTEDKETKKITINEDKMDEFKKEFNELLSIENKYDISLIDECEFYDVEISGKEANSISKLIKA